MRRFATHPLRCRWHFVPDLRQTLLQFIDVMNLMNVANVSMHFVRCDDGRALSITAVVWRRVEQKAVLTFVYIFIWNENLFWGASECGNRISGANFHNNYGSLLLSFWDISHPRTDNGRTTDGRRWQASHIWALRRASNRYGIVGFNVPLVTL